MINKKPIYGFIRGTEISIAYKCLVFVQQIFISSRVEIFFPIVSFTILNIILTSKILIALCLHNKP